MDEQEDGKYDVTDGIGKLFKNTAKREACSSVIRSSEPKNEKKVVNVQHSKFVRQGSALIINNKKFVYMSERMGTMKDESRLTRVLEKFGFTVQVVLDKPREKILEEIKEFSLSRKEDGDDCVIVVVMSHGWAGGQLCASDDKSYTVKDVWQPLVDNQALENTPKIFIFQACRGDSKDIGQILESLTPRKHQAKRSAVQDAQSSFTADVAPFKTTSTADVEIHLPDVPNVLLAYSSVEDYVSWRRGGEGSLYVRALCRALREGPQGANKDLVRCLTRTQRLLALESARERSNKHELEFKQAASFTSYLSYKLYLYPAETKKSFIKTIFDLGSFRNIFK